MTHAALLPDGSVALTKMDLRRELNVAEHLAREAGMLLRERQAAGVKVRFKANGEIVTPADLASNEIICNGLAGEFPSDALWSEETPIFSPARETQRVWIIDPLDSTSNYVQNGDEYSVSIGLAVGGHAVLGVVFNPRRNEIFSGYCGFGASWNGVPVRATFTASEHQPSVLVSMKEWKRGLHTLTTKLPMRTMASMAYKLARVAAGKDDATVSFKRRKAWGICAGAALVTAAGGRITSIDGLPLVFDTQATSISDGLVAAGEKLHSRFLDFARELRSGMKVRYPA
jgi:myo-inositol-1(or 4)-monophosphatase